MMAVATFDGPSLTIKLPALGAYDAKSEIYSEWKRWAALSDNLKYPQAFDTVGGDELSPGQAIAPYFFARNDNGWKIETPDTLGGGDVNIVGNLVRRDTAIPLFQQGLATCFLQLEVSPQALLVDSGGGSGGLTPIESANIKLIPALL
jgi:hypothetical protein